MDVYVVIATKGRPAEVLRLLRLLDCQTVAPHGVSIVGVKDSDVATARDAQITRIGWVDTTLSSKAGLTSQRNVGIERIRARVAQRTGRYAIAFFDDDFRPDSLWLEQAVRLFESQPSVSGLTGCILADGVRGPGIEESAALDYLEGRRAPEPHWASGTTPYDIESLYGCNMAFPDTVFDSCRFDESLPLYGWQEDLDFSAQARTYGRTWFWPACRGVHLGTKGGRISGAKFGYSQIANPLYLVRKGTMTLPRGARFVGRALAANLLRSVREHPLFDYRGRLAGNLTAIADAARGRAHPTRVLEL